MKYHDEGEYYIYSNPIKNWAIRFDNASYCWYMRQPRGWKRNFAREVHNLLWRFRAALKV